MTLEILKGTRDSEPALQITINSIFDTLRARFESFGFRPFDTPLIEYLETLTHKYAPDAEIVSEIFSVKDRGDRQLGLRYDLTTPLCRFIAMHKDLKKPFRRYHIAKVFRDGPVKKGRMREFYQCDCDVVGISGTTIEAELLEMFYLCYTDLGIEVVLELNNNSILKGAFLQEGFKEHEIESLILCVDKLKKIGLSAVLEEISSKGFNTEKAKKVITMLSSNSLPDLELWAKHELFVKGISELKELVSHIQGIVQYRINCTMSRGLAIYTGNIWEVYDVKERVSSALGAGGRYDSVIGEYIGDQKVYPAVGVSIGLEPVLSILGSQSCQGVTDIVALALDEKLHSQVASLCRTLRSQGKKVELFYTPKVTKAFEYAQYLGAKQVLILGKKDAESKQYTLKNIETGSEEKIKY